MVQQSVEIRCQVRKEKSDHVFLLWFKHLILGQAMSQCYGQLHIILTTFVFLQHFENKTKMELVEILYRDIVCELKNLVELVSLCSI